MRDTTPRDARASPGSQRRDHAVAKVTMPQLGESVAEGTIAKGLKKPGDHVAKYEPLLEVITDKVNAEVPSPVEGTLTEILVEEGETVPNNAEIAVIEEAGAEEGKDAPAESASARTSEKASAEGPAGSDERPERAKEPEGARPAAEAARPAAESTRAAAVASPPSSS